ncbi:hypothetical protein GWQ43_08435 [Alcaligenes faecalis]|uniref:hypothetical protein n=1 Tax=Alcaligenes faecalis TaxID=511 RepID=UPI00137B9F5E|nr:hypothetical protein [Alcaligenes faecalis]QHS36084.1 hypothetical protein GWQ43_08435 [Alcaligenes faecalis]
MSANTQDNAPVSAEPVAQYYYKVTGCPAVEASDEKCICWHDKGTGPHPDAQVGDIHSGVTLTWRRPKPTAPVAAQHAATLANIEAFVACDASAISYLSLGEYRTALLKMLRQAPAEKEPGA